MMDRSLTFESHRRTGLPRPILEQKPVPWTQAEADWGKIDTVRQHRCTDHSLCLVCGEHVLHGIVFASIEGLFGTISTERIPLTAIYDDLPERWVSDSGPCHSRCAKLTYAHCTHVRDEVDRGVTFMIEYVDTRFQTL